MDKKLPNVFHNKIDKKINNNSEYYYSADSTRREENIEFSEDPKDINQKINDIFSSPNYIYKANVAIKTKDDTYITKIIGRNKDYLITMDNKTIAINQIIDIKIVRNN